MAVQCCKHSRRGGVKLSGNLPHGEALFSELKHSTPFRGGKFTNGRHLEVNYCVCCGVNAVSDGGGRVGFCLLGPNC